MAALRNVRAVGILYGAVGMDRIYPEEHGSELSQMWKQGEDEKIQAGFRPIWAGRRHISYLFGMQLGVGNPLLA